MKHLCVVCMLAVLLVLSVSAVRAEVTPPTPSIPASSAPAATGTIAYVIPDDTTGDQVWLIEPDGSKKRKIYSTGIADPYAVDGISGLTWRPDSAELVFASSHEKDCSWFTSDLFAIRVDGSGYRRVTNAPDCAALASYPKKGEVTISVPVDGYQAYIMGAPGLKTVYSGPNTFNNVADLGNFKQPLVFIWGQYRWFSDPIDVKEGENVSASVDLYGTGLKELGAYQPAWRSDGSRIGYSYGGCAGLYGIAAQPPAGTWGDMMLTTLDGVSPCGMAWGPTPSTANQMVYWTNLPGDGGIYLTTENSHSAGTKLVTKDVYIFDVEYLPNASGLIFAMVDNGGISSNIYRYDFASGNLTQVTNYADKYARYFALSPDGQKIIFELNTPEWAGLWGGPSDLYMMGIGGSTPQLFVTGGAYPSWSLGAPQVPPGTTLPTNKLYLPLLRR